MRLLAFAPFFLAGTLLAQQPTVAPAPGVLGKGAETIWGSALATALELPGNPPAFIARGIVVRRAFDLQFAFDVDRLQPVAAWAQGFLELSRTNIGTYKGLGNGAALPKGHLLPFDAAAARLHIAPAQSVRYRGVYEIERTREPWNEIIFSYEAGSVPVLDCGTLNFGKVAGEFTFTRELSVGPRVQPVSFRIPDFKGDVPSPWQLVHQGPQEEAELLCPAGNDWAHLQLSATFGGEAPKPTATAFGAEPRDLRAVIQAAPAKQMQTYLVHGKRTEDKGPYVIDPIPLPDENEQKMWLRPTGLDFLPDGRLAICTLGGDVWIAKGLDDSLSHVEWSLFAQGLREPMGLRIVSGEIYVGCRDQIIRLHDTDHDGTADFYECINNGRTLVPNFHAFAYDLQTDRAGNFYFGTGGNQLGPDEPWHAKLFRVSPNGDKLEAIASGLRAPNGLTIGPDDSIYVAENQGQWIPSSKISRIKTGGFYGFVADPKFTKAVAPASFEAPMCYLPMNWDNSSGGGAFCESNRWGPLKGRMVHTSFGAAALFAIFEQRVGEVSQAMAIKFPLPPFESGICRARFNPKDGQLYVAGLKGWQSKAVSDGCLARVRYTGQPVKWPTGFHVAKDALVIEFSTPVDSASAGDAQNYGAEQWNYQWHATYGSPDVTITDPKKRGRDKVEIRSAKVAPDGKSVTLEVPGPVPVMQMQIKMNIKSADGTPVEAELAGTINVVP